MRRKCELLDLNRTTLYYVPVPIDIYNFELMNRIDAIYTDKPYYGSPRITAQLIREGYFVNIKRIKRLMQLMGIEAIYPKKNLSKGNKVHKKYPYLLKGVDIISPNQVWSTDITYIRIKHGFLYLVAVMDWFSRYVLSWELSNTIDTYFCVKALKDAFVKYGIPVVFNTDQGSQFSSDEFIGQLNNKNIAISMTSTGRALDNIFIERLWRSLKYEDIYIKNYETGIELYDGLKNYFNVYNTERLHQSLEYKTPFEVYSGLV